MCRLAAYIGPAIPIENIVTRPQHSLIIQSQVAEEAKLAVNGDGFGLAWYAEDEAPALYKEVMPAWANPNLLHICKAVQSSNFIAHVRASTFGGASYQNCHPFTYGRWSFAHNGKIGGFDLIRRELESTLSDEIFAHRTGITDSELLFLLIVHHELNHMPFTACQKAIVQIENSHRSSKTNQPLRLTFILSDGNRLFACRYASDGRAPTLYRSKELQHGGTAIASEPLDGDPTNWESIAEGEFVEFDHQKLDSQRLHMNHFAAA